LILPWPHHQRRPLRIRADRGVFGGGRTALYFDDAHPALDLGAHQVDVQEAIVEQGAAHFDALGENKRSLELTGGDPAVQVDALSHTVHLPGIFGTRQTGNQATRQATRLVRRPPLLAVSRKSPLVDHDIAVGVLPPLHRDPHINRRALSLERASGTMSRRLLLNWRNLLALFFSATLALAPAIAEARAGSSSGGGSSGMGSRGSRTYENNGAQPLSRSVTPLPQTPRSPGLAPATPSPAYAGGGSFFQRHPFLTGLAGGMIGSWLFGHAGWGADGAGGSAGSMLGMLLQFLIIGLLIYFAVRLFRGRALSGGWGGGNSGPMPRSAGAAAAPALRDRGRDITLSDADLGVFPTIHAGVQEAWSG